jgi:hypothetical protein
MTHSRDVATYLRLADRLLNDREPTEERKSPVAAAILWWSASREAAGRRGGRSAQLRTMFNDTRGCLLAREVVSVLKCGLQCPPLAL